MVAGTPPRRERSGCLRPVFPVPSGRTVVVGHAFLSRFRVTSKPMAAAQKSIKQLITFMIIVSDGHLQERLARRFLSVVSMCLALLFFCFLQDGSSLPPPARRGIGFGAARASRLSDAAGCVADCATLWLSVARIKCHRAAGTVSLRPRRESPGKGLAKRKGGEHGGQA